MWLTLRLELVRCGKPKCDKRHGPYWYVCWREGRRTVKAYVGRSVPESLAHRVRNQKRDDEQARALESLEEPPESSR